MKITKYRTSRRISLATRRSLPPFPFSPFPLFFLFFLFLSFPPPLLSPFTFLFIFYFIFYNILLNPKPNNNKRQEE